MDHKPGRWHAGWSRRAEVGAGLIQQDDLVALLAVLVGEAPADIRDPIGRVVKDIQDTVRGIGNVQPRLASGVGLGGWASH